MDLDPELSALRPLGGFFVLRPAGDPPRPLPSLARIYENRTSDVYGDFLTFRVRKVGAALHTSEERVAASIAQQGFAARLWSVALGCAVLYGRIPDLDPRLLRWDPDGSAPDDLWPSVIRPLPGDAATVAESVLLGHLEPLSAALRARHRLAPGLLRGNAGSALAGAAGQLDRWARAHGRPDAAARARALTAELFAHPLLAETGTGTRTRADSATEAGPDTGRGAGTGGAAFRRRSCCLYYRVPGGGVCGDCCFTRPPRSSAHGRSG